MSPAPGPHRWQKPAKPDAVAAPGEYDRDAVRAEIGRLQRRLPLLRREATALKALEEGMAELEQVRSEIEAFERENGADAERTSGR